MKIKGLSVVMMACAIGLTSSICDPNHNCSVNGDIINDIGGGNYTIVNMGTNDTLRIQGGVNINVGGNPILNAYNGNVVKITFEPKEEYKVYPFNVKYTLPDGNVIENQMEYEYLVSDVEPGDYTIGLYAKSEGNTKKSSWNISAGGGNFTLRVIQ